jgi:hypothetical protein
MQSVSMQIGFIAACVGGITFLIGFLYSVYKVIRRVESAIGTDEKGRTVSDRMERVEYQLWENGGSSLADRVNTIGKQADQMAVEVQIIKDVLLKLLAMPEIEVEPAVKKRTRSKKVEA